MTDSVTLIVSSFSLCLHTYAMKRKRAGVLRRIISFRCMQNNV